MKKMILLLTAPFLLVDACSSARLTKKDTGNEKLTNVSVANNDHVSIPQSNSTEKKQIVVRQLSNGEFDLSPRFAPEIKDHYRKGIIQLKVTPDE